MGQGSRAVWFLGMLATHPGTEIHFGDVTPASKPGAVMSRFPGLRSDLPGRVELFALFDPLVLPACRRPLPGLARSPALLAVALLPAGGSRDRRRMADERGGPPERPARAWIAEHRRRIAACDFAFLHELIERESAIYDNGDRVIYRVLFAAEGRRSQVLLALEAFTKKTQKTPPKSIVLARERLADWRARGRRPWGLADALCFLSITPQGRRDDRRRKR